EMLDPILGEIINYQATDQILSVGLWLLAMVWFGFFGGSLASFLTVVWDRMGTGEGIVYSRSRCPECDHEIRWYHNLPVVGWLLLGGHCYDCGTPIPAKHPLIEAVFAAVFMVIGAMILKRITL